MYSSDNNKDNFEKAINVLKNAGYAIIHIDHNNPVKPAMKA